MAQGSSPGASLKLFLFVVVDRHGRQRVPLRVPLDETESCIFECYEKRLASVARVWCFYSGKPSDGAGQRDLGDEDQLRAVGTIRLLRQAVAS